jgi:hypothetical protein
MRRLLAPPRAALWPLLGLSLLLVAAGGCGEDPEAATPGGCQTDGDCMDGLHCQAALRSCHECVNDSHCAADELCRSLTCQPREAPDMSEEPDTEDADVTDDADMGSPDAPDAEDAPDVEDTPDVEDAPDMAVGCEPACQGLQRCDAEAGVCVEPRICLSDADCVGENLCFGSRCLTPPQIIEAGGCTDDESCDAQGEGLFCNLEGHSCTPSGRCNSDAQCPDGLACGPGGLCVECAGDDDCPGGLECDTGQGANLCVEPDRCGGDGDCRGDRICQGAACNEPSCAEDRYDGNQGCADAAAVSADLSEALQICGATCDWFAVNLQQGDGFLARVLHEPRDGDLDLSLYEGPCEQGEVTRRLSRSATLNGAEIVSVPRGFADTTYYLEVCPFVGAQDGGTNAYTLDVMYVEGGYCVDDYIEAIRANDRPERASPISINERPFSIEYNELQVCPGAPDWYLVSLNPGDFLTAEIEFNNAFGNLDLAVFGQLPGDLFDTALDRSQANGNAEVVTAVTDQFTDLYLAIYSPTGDQNEYRLRLNVTGADQGCGDRFEPRPADANNDTRLSATDLGAVPPSTISGLRLCAGDDPDVDWYAVDVPAGMAAVVTINYDPNLGTELQASLYNSAQDTTATQQRGGGGVLSFPLLPDGGQGEVAFALTWPGDQDITYTLAYELRAANDVCVDDGRGNTSAQTAQETVLGVRESRGTVCAGGEDWYQVEVPAMTELTAEILDREAPLTLELVDSEGAVLSAATPGSFGPLAFARLTEAQTVYARVRGATPQSAASYLLQLYSQPFTEGLACADDPLERGSSDNSRDNDTWENGRQISSGNWLRNLLLCPEDTDWYFIQIIAGSPIMITVQSHAPAQGAIQARLWDPSGPMFGSPVINTTQTSNGALILSIDGVEVFDGGIWALELFSEAGSVQWYDVQVLTN